MSLHTDAPQCKLFHNLWSLGVGLPHHRTTGTAWSGHAKKLCETHQDDENFSNVSLSSRLMTAEVTQRRNDGKSRVGLVKAHGAVQR